jgi:hypothetical protein
MAKNKLGLRRSGGGKSGTPRVSSHGAQGGHGLAPDMHLKRPYLPDTPQDNVRDADNSGRIRNAQHG